MSRASISSSCAWKSSGTPAGSSAHGPPGSSSERRSRSTISSTVSITRELDRRGLHARGAGDGHRAGGEVDLLDARVLDHLTAALDVRAEDVVGVVVDEVDLRAGVDALPGRADDKRRLAALGDGEDHVAGRHAEIANLLPAERGEVLEPLDRLDEREVAAGHHAERAVFPRLGGRRARKAAGPLALPEVAPDRHELDAEAAGRAAAGEEEPPAPPEAAGQLRRDARRAARRDKRPERPDHVVVHVEEQAERGRRVAGRRVARDPPSPGATPR